MATSTLEGTYKSILQGVSQQVPRLRLDGQVHTQVNMLSDPVTSVRRRPPVEYQATYGLGEVTTLNLFTQFLERGADARNLVINTTTGGWWLLDKDTKNVLNSGADPYFVSTTGMNAIQTTSVGGETFILNIEKSPVVETTSTKLDPSKTGFFYIKASAFSKEYDIMVTNNGTTATTSYTTPDGTQEGDVQKSTADAIAAQLVTQLQAIGTGLTFTRVGSYVYVSGGNNLSVNSNAGTTFMGVSKSHNVDIIGNLPAQLPPSADGMIMSVGTDGNALVWYRWDSARMSWLEDSAYGSPSGLSNMPRVLHSDDTLAAPKFEGRLAGDDSTNEDPTFITNGIITGLTTYQGRLVLLSGAFASMSKAGNSYRFYRSTVTDALSSDRIDIGMGSSQNSVLRRGIQFNRDLILFGDSIQAVVSAGGGVLSPSTAAISLTSEMSCTSKVAPLLSGQTVLYPYKRSARYSGMLELIPSQYTASQYISQDATGHLPEFISGEIRFTSSSNVVKMCLLGSTDSPNTLYIHEYQWSSEGKQQAAWHSWEFSLPVVAAYFARERLIVMFKDGDNVYTSIVDPRQGYDNQTLSALPYIDLARSVVVQNGNFTLPTELRGAYTTGATLAMAFSSGTDVTTEVGIANVNTQTWTGSVVAGVSDGTYTVGLRYLSKFTPTPPILRDENGKEVGAGHVRLVRMELAVRNTGVFGTQVEDIRTDVDCESEVTGVFLNSTELLPSHPMVISQANVLVPCRTMADTTFVTFSTDGTHDLNILDISYILRYNQRRRRV